MERGLLDAFCNLAPEGAIVDIGCGPGHITQFLAFELWPEMIAGAVAMYSIIHLDPAQRARAFAEFARVLGPAGLLLMSFHVDGQGLAPGDINHVTTFLGHSVDMDGYFLDPAVATTDLMANGFRVEARLDREPIAGIEFREPTVLHRGPPGGTVVAWATTMITSATFRPAWPSNSNWPTPEWCRSGIAHF